MKYKFLMIIFFSLSITSIWAKEADFFSFNGYGTVGGAYQDKDDVLYKDSAYATRGSEGEFSFANYSILGLQLDVEASKNLTFTLQGLVSPNNENGKMLEIEWANVKYQFSDTFDVRVGMMRSPAFMFSDILHVAYSYDWVRLPDMYALVPFNKYKGVEFSHYLNFNNLSIASTLLYGQTKSYFRNGKGTTSDAKADDIYGIAVKLLYHDFLLRVGYSVTDYTMNDKYVNRLSSQYGALGISNISDFIQKYKMQDTPLSYFNIGAKYDFSDAYILGEYMQVDTNSFIADRYSWYVGGGYNFETWTPYFLYSKTIDSPNFGQISTEGVSPPVELVISGANQILSSVAEEVDIEIETLSFGARYDISDNILVKLQYDRQKRIEADLDVFSCAVNFVF